MSKKTLILASDSSHDLFKFLSLSFKFDVFNVLDLYTFIYTLEVTYMYCNVLYRIHLRMAHVGRNM
jgi:hypothetical protein